MTSRDVQAAADLQALAFPPPFPQDLLWGADHLQKHLEIFPAAQFVAEIDGVVVGSCSNTLISEGDWTRHDSWAETVGGPFLESFDSAGTTLYGLDITVHPAHQRIGIGRAFYEARLALVRQLALQRYGTACRMPGYSTYTLAHAAITPAVYADRVVKGLATDRTLTPLLRYGLNFLGVIENYMEDRESGHAAALLEWKP